MRCRRSSWVVLALALTVVRAGGAVAADPAGLEISATEMRQVARAQLRIAEIQGRYSARLKASADDPETSLRLQEQGHREIVQAVRAAGLDVESFKLMMWSIPRDPDLKRRFFATLEAQRVVADRK